MSDSLDASASTVGSTPSPGPSSVFLTTHWSVVKAAGSSETTRGQVALEELCTAYWHPLYHYVRRRGFAPEESQDLTQEFFARLLQRRLLAKADPDRGRFRSFLLSSLKNFLADEWQKNRALKRGGGMVLSLDFQSEESRVAAEPASGLTPEKAFERRWALSLLEQVYQQLESEWQNNGKSKHFSILRSSLAGSSDSLPHSALAAQLGMSEGAARVAVHRLRQRYRQLLRDAIAQTVEAPEEVDEELRYLQQVLST